MLVSRKRWDRAQAQYSSRGVRGGIVVAWRGDLEDERRGMEERDERKL
jgi:hypothetical protein